MKGSLLQATPKKAVVNYDEMKTSRSRQSNGKMVGFTQVLVQTFDNDVPYIAIYKPDIKRQQRRVQAITALEKCLKKFQFSRIQFTFSKFYCLKHQQQAVAYNIHNFSNLFSKIIRKRTAHGFLQLATNNLKHKSLITGIKLLAYYESKIKGNFIKHAMNGIKIHSYQTLVSTLTNENELSKELTQAKNELYKLKTGAFSQQFLQSSKTFIKLTDYNTFIDNIRESGYQNIIRSETTRLEQNRSKLTPKKKDLFENEVITTVFENTIKAYQSNIAEHIRYEQDLKLQLQAYTNTQGINQLNEIIREKDNILNELQGFVTEITRMDTELKKFSGQKYNYDKILSLLGQQEKKLQVRSKKSQGMIPKLYNSRVFLDSLIAQSIKKINQQKQAINKQLDELIDISNEENTLRVFIKKVKQSISIKNVTQVILNFHQTINQSYNDSEHLKTSIEQLTKRNQDLTKKIEDLNAQRQKQLQNNKKLNKQIQQLKEREEKAKLSIQQFQKFISENWKKIENHSKLNLSIKVKIGQQLQSIFTFLVNILKHIEKLQSQLQQNNNTIEQLKKRQQNAQKQTIQPTVSPQKQKQDLVERQVSFDRLLSQLKSILENRQEDKELKQHMLSFQAKFEEIIRQNNFLRQKILSLQTSDKKVQDLTQQISRLKEENQNLKRTNIDIVNKFQQTKEKLLLLTQQNTKIEHLNNRITEYETRLKQLQIINAELNEKIISLKESNSQFSSIASSNQEISFKINEIYNKNINTKVTVQGNGQQLSDILSFSAKFEEIISQNNFLKQNILNLQTNDKIVQDLTQQILRLKEQNENLRRNNIDIVNRLEQTNERLHFLTEQNAKIEHLFNKIGEYEARLRQLQIINAELNEKIVSLKQSNAQFSSIASFNQELSLKINQIYNKNINTKITVQGNGQQFHDMLSFQTKFEEIIRQNNFLRQTILNLQASDNAVQDFKQQILRLKEQNENLRRNNIDIVNRFEQTNERLRFLTEQNAKIEHLFNRIAEYEARLRQLQIINVELNQKIVSLRQSNAQFSSIASSNHELTLKINQICNKNINTKITVQGNEQQLQKQAQLMQQILSLKIQVENTAIRHLQEITSLKNEINSYQTIISKLETDIFHRENDCVHKQNIIRNLSAQFQELRVINIQLRGKVEQFQKVVNIQKSRGDEAELNRLRQDCASMYEHLQVTIQNLRAKDNQFIELQRTLATHLQIIANLKKDNERLVINIQELITTNQQLSQQIAKYKIQITQIKSQYHQMQLQFHNSEMSHEQISHSTQIYQKEIQQKQLIINNLIQQAKALSALHTAQLNQLKQEFISKQRVLEERLSDKDLKISKLEFQLNQKINTVMSLEQLISLYANSSEVTLKQEIERYHYPYSRDKEITYLRGQIKSLEEFLNDMNGQYQELEKRYQQERERTNRAYLNISPVSYEKVQQRKEEVNKTVVFSQENNKQVRFLDEVSERFNHSFMSNINMTFTEADITKQLNRLMASNESLANSVDYLREENKDLFLKVKSITSIEMVIELIFNILLSIGKFKSDSSEGVKVWHDLSHLRSAFSGETLFLKLEEYCRQFVAACRG